MICRHQGSGCCFSCTAKFHRNRFSCPKCQGRSFTLVSFTLPCWTVYACRSLTVSLTTQQVELCSEGNWRRQWHPTPVLLPGKSHGWRRLVGCSPWDREESDTTERLHFHFSLSCIGEGSGNPLQCSCLENPRDGGAWWAAVYEVAQSRTRLT